MKMCQRCLGEVQRNMNFNKMVDTSNQFWTRYLTEEKLKLTPTNNSEDKYLDFNRSEMNLMLHVNFPSLIGRDFGGPSLEHPAQIDQSSGHNLDFDKMFTGLAYDSYDPVTEIFHSFHDATSFWDSPDLDFINPSDFGETAFIQTEFETNSERNGGNTVNLMPENYCVPAVIGVDVEEPAYPENDENPKPNEETPNVSLRRSKRLNCSGSDIHCKAENVQPIKKIKKNVPLRRSKILNSTSCSGSDIQFKVENVQPIEETSDVPLRRSKRLNH